MSNFYTKCCSVTLVMLLYITTLFAQQTVTGTVTDANGALPGVSVTVLGTNRATQTDANGKYSIQANNGEKIRFSIMGYTRQEISVSGNNHNVTLQQDASNIDEVVVTAMVSKESVNPWDTHSRR